MTEGRQLWCIRENFTKTWCNSSKFGSFGSFDDAVIFVSEENAKKAIKKMDRSAETYNRLQINDSYCIFDVRAKLDVKAMQDSGITVIHGEPVFEAVECLLST